MKRLLAPLLLLTLFAAACGEDRETGQEAYERGDYAAALREFRPLAEEGDAEAQFRLGLMYLNGQGVEEDTAEGLKWLWKAADQGHAKAREMTTLLKEGLNYAGAAEWYRKSAEQGDADAQYNLGYLYRTGQGVERDLAEAARWYRKAAAQGHVDAQYKLGLMHAAGQGVSQDYGEAAGWYRKAAAQGHAGARNNLATMYLSGRGVPQDSSEALRLFILAAEQGNTGAQVNLGAMHANGRGVPEDLVQALKWFYIAAENGSERGAAYRDRAAKELDPPQVEKARAMADDWLAAFEAGEK